jgi:nitrogen fixation protein FixH
MTTHAAPTSSNQPPASRSRRWAYIFIGLLTFHAGGTIAMVVIATSDPSFAVEPNYYEQALNWDAAAAQSLQNEHLGWTAQVQITAVQGPAERGRMVSVRLRNSDGVGLEGARIAVECFHHARSADRIHGELAAVSGGLYSGLLQLDRPGEWEIRLVIERGPERFTQRTHISVPAAPPGGGA